MDERKKNNIWDYMPVVAFTLFLLTSSLGGSLTIGDPALIKLGVVALPAIIAVIMSFIRIRAIHRSKE